MSDDSYYYEPRTDGTHTAARLPDCDLVPGGVAGHTLVAFGSAIYAFGGKAVLVDDGGETASDRLLKYEIETKKWIEIERERGEQWPSARFYHSAVLHGSKMVVFGGENAATALDDLWELDLPSGRWSGRSFEGSKPQPRTHHGSFVRDGLLYVFGGKSPSNDNMWAVDLDNPASSWMPQPFAGKVPVDCFNTYAFVDGFAYVSDGEVQEQLRRYDFGSSTWTPLDAFGMGGHAMTSMDGWLVITCGMDALGPSANVRSFDTNAVGMKEWGFLDNVEYANAGKEEKAGFIYEDHYLPEVWEHGSCAVGRSVFVFGGMDVGEGRSSNHLWEVRVDLPPREEK